MKKLISVYAFVMLLSAVKGQQCPACPFVFLLRDTIQCNSVDVVRNPTAGPGYSNAFVPIVACKNSTMRYFLTPNPLTCFSGISYTFVSITGGALINFSNTGFTVQWGGSATGTIVMLFNTPFGSGNAPCRDSITLNYTLTTNPVAAFTSSLQPACFNNPTNIAFNSGGSMNATNYYWDFGDGYTSTQANPTHAYSAPGTFSVTLIVSNMAVINGAPVCPSCTDSVHHNVIINNLPGPPINCVASVCAGATEKYCTSAGGCSSYSWTVTGGTITGGQNTPCITVVWGSGSPQGIINLIVSGCAVAYCAQGTTVNVPVIPVTGSINGPLLVCAPSASVYTLPSWPGTTYSWNLSGGGSFSPNNTNTNQVTINWSSPGNHTVTATYFDTALKCGGSASQIVQVRTPLNITGATSICKGLTGSLSSSSSPGGPVSSNWSVSPAGPTIVSGNGTPNAVFNWPTAGTFIVTAVAITPGVVCSNATYTVTVKPAPVLTMINGLDSICPNQTNVYSVTSNSNGAYTWIINNGTATLLGANNDSVQVNWNAAGPYSVTVSQISFPNNCMSNTLTKNVFAYPAPAVNGPINVCADNTESYFVTNILSGNFQWYVTPPSFGTILSGQGTSTVSVKWHGNNSPGNTNTVFLHYGVCNADSIAVVINEPAAVTITASGSLCSGGVTLSTGATGIFTWTGVEHPLVPSPGNVSSVSGIQYGGHYNVQIQNYNGSGCTVNGSYFLPDIGRPVASVSADNVLFYCFPNPANLNLIAANSPGYTFQWFLGNTLAGTNAVLPVSQTAVGAYTYHCVVSLGTCTDTSMNITVVISNCPPVPPGPCAGAGLSVTSISGCNPFTLSVAPLSPAGATLIGNPTIFHYEDGSSVNSYTTHTYTSAGFKQITICADILMPDMGTICRVCKDTVVPVTAAANFTGNIGCGSISLFNTSNVIAPATINSYGWTTGLNPGNTPVPPGAAMFNNATIPNPVLTINQSGSYIVTLSIKVGTCFIIHRDTFNVHVPDADFNVANSCAGTTVPFNNLFPELINFWDFGDAATSYTSPAFHAYGTANTYAVTHIVTDVNGCKDTVVKPVTIIPSPVCNISYTGPANFCFGDSLFLNACAGLTNIQWYNNGVAISGSVNSVDTVTQTGNYSFTAVSAGGCRVISDTVSVSVSQPPGATVAFSGTRCAGTNFTASIPACAGCTYSWTVDGNPASTASFISGTVGVSPFTIGTHSIAVTVINGSGCSASGSAPVTFNALPTVNINVSGNPTQLCSNNFYGLTAVSNAASPVWAWTYNNAGPALSAANFLNVSATGIYTVTVTNGITGCSNTSSKNVLQSPELNLFPAGCDTLCDTSHLFLPLASFNGNLAGYTINWYDNAPPYGTPVGSGPSFPLNSLTLGNHNLSVIVTSPNNCVDTSNVYRLRTYYCGNVVSVRQLSVTARQVGSVALVRWTTISETENDHFTVERSPDGIHFAAAGNVLSRGNSSSPQDYFLNDPITEYNRFIYYRIKAVDRIGGYIYSSIVRIKPLRSEEEFISANPNVTKANSLIVIQSAASLKSSIRIFSSEGRLVKSVAITLVKGINELPLNVEDLSPGIYVLTVTGKDKKLTTRLVRN